MYRIAIDAFGGDNAPAAVVEGCAQALKDFSDITLVLCGAKTALENELSRVGCTSERAEIIDAPEIIGMDEHPVNAIRRKKDSSMVRALTEVAQKRADAVISAGSTGALLAGGTFVVKRLPGIKRPALAPALPTLGKNPVLLIDSGANAECRPEYLVQFAIMGSSYMNSLYGVETPRVGLLNIGSEAEKGDELRKEAYKLLSAQSGINFVGNCEARDMLSGEYDVIAADGFSGNIALKSVEGAAGVLFSMIKRELSAGTLEKLGGALARPAFRRVKHSMDYTEYGGAMLLGVDGGVIKSHGSSNARAFYSCIRQAREFIDGGVVEKTKRAMALTAQGSTEE